MKEAKRVRAGRTSKRKGKFWSLVVLVTLQIVFNIGIIFTFLIIENIKMHRVLQSVLHNVLRFL